MYDSFCRVFVKWEDRVWLLIIFVATEFPIELQRDSARGRWMARPSLARTNLLSGTTPKFTFLYVSPSLAGELP